MTQSSTIKISIVDDHPLVIDGLTLVLNNIDEFEIIATYNRAEDVLSSIDKNYPDVLLLDIELPDSTGTELARKLIKAYPELKILVLSGLSFHDVIRDMIKIGCKGYILKAGTNRQLLTEAIHAAHKGTLYIDPSIRDEFYHASIVAEKKMQKLAPKLSSREKEVLELVLLEMDNHQIAEQLCLSLRTIENHRYNILQKLNVKNTVGLVKAALNLGIGKSK